GAAGAPADDACRASHHARRLGHARSAAVTLALLCAAELVGLLAGTLDEQLNLPGLLVSAGLASLGALLTRHRPGARIVAMACVAAALGAVRAQVAPSRAGGDADPLANFAGVQVTLRGQVASAPVRTERSLRLLLAVDTLNGQPAQ